MALFYNRKPRSFHHEYIYVDERKEFIDKLKAKYENKKASLDTESLSTDAYFRYHKAMEERVKEEFRSNSQRTHKTNFLHLIPTVLLLLLLILLFVAVWFCFS